MSNLAFKGHQEENQHQAPFLGVGGSEWPTKTEGERPLVHGMQLIELIQPGKVISGPRQGRDFHELPAAGFGEGFGALGKRKEYRTRLRLFSESHGRHRKPLVSRYEMKQDQLMLVSNTRPADAGKQLPPRCPLVPTFLWEIRKHIGYCTTSF